MNIISKIIKASLFTSTLAVACLSQYALAADYYVNNDGSDNFDGLSPEQAFQTLDEINSLELQPGDNVYLAAGQTFLGNIKLSNVSGTVELPITISNYGDLSERAIIDAAGELAGIELLNTRHVYLSNLEIVADGGAQQNYRGWSKSPMRLGILIDVNSMDNSKPFGYVTMDNLYIHDIYYEEFGYAGRGSDVNTPNGTQAYGWGVRLYNNNNGTTELSNITMKNSEIADVAHTAFKVTSNSNRDVNQRRWGNVYDVELSNNYFHDIGGPGIQFGGTNSGYVGHNKVHRTGSGDDSRKWSRGSGMWPWGSKNLLIEHNEFTDAQGPADSAGFHIDFNCSNIVVQYNLSKNNAGGFIEILGNNENNSYRYNISINDGYRKKGVDGASHDGKTLWLSGYVGKNNPQIAPKNNYIYNNTIFVNAEQLAQFAVHNETDGLLVANNIFAIEGSSKHIDQAIYQLIDGENPTQDILVSNNVFLSADNWPATLLAQSTNALIGDPQFANKGGYTVADYIPENVTLIANKGIQINAFVDDAIGLVPGFILEKDVLGNAINDNQHIGAISPFDTVSPQAEFSSIVSGTTFEDVVTVTLAFNEDIQDLALANLKVTNGTVSNLNKMTAQQWQFDLMPLTFGDVLVELNSEQVFDLADNAANSASFNIVFEQPQDHNDTKAPVLSMSGPSVTTISNATFNLTLDFDEVIIGFVFSDLVVTNATLSNFTKVTNQQWTVEVTAASNGDVTIQLPENSTHDSAGNGNVEALYSVTYKQNSAIAKPESSAGSGGAILYLLILLVMPLLNKLIKVKLCKY